MRTSLPLTLCCLFLAATDAGAQANPTPVLVAAAGGWVALEGLPPILDDEEVRHRLTSGLTTSFHFSVDLRGDEGKGGARVEIRYLLWEEAFQVTAYGLDGSVAQSQQATPEALRAWWRNLRLVVLEETPADGRSAPVRVTLDVLPFSAREEEDTQRWLSETLNRDGESPGAVQRPGQRESSLGQVFNVLIATSIRRRAVRSYLWTLARPGGAPP
jgi:hypothetical protein